MLCVSVCTSKQFFNILPVFEKINDDIISVLPARMQFRSESGQEPTMQFVVALLSMSMANKR